MMILITTRSVFNFYYDTLQPRFYLMIMAFVNDSFVSCYFLRDLKAVPKSGPESEIEAETTTTNTILLPIRRGLYHYSKYLNVNTHTHRHDNYCILWMVTRLVKLPVWCSTLTLISTTTPWVELRRASTHHRSGNTQTRSVDNNIQHCSSHLGLRFP